MLTREQITQARYNRIQNGISIHDLCDQAEAAIELRERLNELLEVAKRAQQTGGHSMDLNNDLLLAIVRAERLETRPRADADTPHINRT